MSRTTLTAQQIARTGTAPSFGAANSDGSALANDGREFIHVKNGGGSSINVTIQTPGTVDGNAIADLVVAVGAAAEKKIGPFPPDTYNQDDGSIYIDYSAVGSVTVAAFRL